MNERAKQQPVAMRITVNLTALITAECDAGGYSGSIPALPGCFSQGETFEEVAENLREAAEGWLESAHDEAVTSQVEREGAA